MVKVIGILMSLYESKTYIEDLRMSAGASIGISSLKNKTILITGATGTIGSFLVDMLMQYNRDENAGIKLYASARSNERLSDRFGDIADDNLVFVEYDVCKSIEFDFDVDYIIHAAGNAHPSAFNGDPVGTILGNVTGTGELLKYALKHKTQRFLYVSSGEVYGQGDISLDSFTEGYAGYLDPSSPRSCYPMSKRATENLCASFTSQYGLETVVVRPCHTYGPGITSTDSRANVQFMRNVLNGEDIVMKSAGTQERSYCYMADCASAVITVLLNGKSGEAYNTANPNARITIAGLAEVIAKTRSRKVVFADPSALDIANQTPIAKQVLATEKLEGLGWRGAYTVEKGIAHTIDILQGK